MIDTGYKLPTTTPSPGINNAWDNPSNAFATDGSFTTWTLRASTLQDYGTFGFGIPSGVTINGIELTVTGKVASSTHGLTVYLNGDTGVSKTVILTTTNTAHVAGGSSDLWGTTWEPSDFADSIFSATIEVVDALTYSVDSIQLKVYYTPVASFTTSISKGPTPLTVDFTDTSSPTPSSWSWDFGDGQTSTVQSPSHTYARSGTFTAELTAAWPSDILSATASIQALPFDLSKVQSTTTANSFKNDGLVYKGDIVFPTSIPGGSFSTSTVNFTVSVAPQFCVLYAYFQEFMDVGTANPAQWYQTSINTKIGLTVSGKPTLDAIIYPVINGTTITVTGLVNNPYSTSISLTQLTVPFAFVNYGLAN